MSNQQNKQQSVRSVTGTSGTQADDWVALFNADGIAAGFFNERMLAWINSRLGTTHTNINDAKRAFADNQGVSSWNELGTFDASGFDIFVDSVNGSDGNAGTNSGAPLQTLSAAQSAAVEGSRIGLARGSHWREQFTVPANNITLGVYGSGDMPVIDGADIVTGGWTQPDSVTYPNVWSQSWTRSSTTTTGSEYLGYWQEGVRTTLQTDLTALQAGTDGDWHTTSLTLQTSTVSIRAASDPNADGILREITKRHYGVNGHSVTVGSTKTGQSFTGPIELKRCVGQYNALSMGPGTASKLLLRDGNIHHSVSEGNLTDVVMAEYHPSIAPSMVAFYRATSSGFAPVGTRVLALLPGGSGRVNDASAFYSHGGSGKVDSLTLNGCLSRGVSFCNSDALLLTINGGYCEDSPTRGVDFGATNNVVDYMVVRETAASAFSASNAGFFTASGSATDATVKHSAVYLLKGTGAGQFNTTNRHAYEKCSFVVPGSSIYGGGPDVRYCVCQGGRTYDQLLSSYTGDYNVFYFAGQANPQFHYNGVVYGTLADFQTASGQDANSVFLKAADQVSGNGIAFWLGVADGTNAGPADGDWRINPSAKVYNGAGAALTGLFADGVTPITDAGPQGYWNFNTRAVTSGPPTAYPTLPSTVAEMRSYVEAPASWDFYP